MNAAVGSGNEQGLLVLDSAAIRAVIDIPACIAATADALRKTADGTARQDIRRTLALPGAVGSCMSLMYAAIDDLPLFGAKVLSVLPGNFDHALPSHRGAIILFEKEHGRPVALLDGGEVTAWRTAAASAVATQLLSRPQSGTLAVLGYGEQALRHILAIAQVSPIRTVRVWGRDFGKAQRFAEHPLLAPWQVTASSTVPAATDGADIICTTTSSSTPVLLGELLQPGMHVNAVGASVPSCREIDADCVVRSQIWVDYLPMAWTAAGELIDAFAAGLITRDHVRGEIGSVLGGAVGRRQDDEITLFRSLGVAAEDIELSNAIYQAALRAGRGQTIQFGV